MALVVNNRQVIFSGKFLKVWDSTFFDKQGKEGHWEWIERQSSVFVFPVTSDGSVVLIENYRVPLERYVIEIPAGLKEYDQESDEEVGRRELLEETGYTAQKFTRLRPWPYRSGSSNGLCNGFVATGLQKVREYTGDVTEDITVLEVEMEKLLDFYYNLPQDVLFNIEILALHSIVSRMKF